MGMPRIGGMSQIRKRCGDSHGIRNLTNSDPVSMRKPSAGWAGFREKKVPLAAHPPPATNHWQK